MRTLQGCKLQIALEFIIVFSVITIIFLVFFALVSQQRASILNSQQSLYMQIFSQNIASAIAYAASAGNGYSVTFALPSQINGIPISVYISSAGTVIVNASVGSQRLSAQAYTTARRLIINGSVAFSNPYVTIYKIPTYTGQLSITNYYGTLYINSKPSMPVAYPAVSYSARSGSIAFFNRTSYANSSGAVNLTNGGTISAWIYPTYFPSNNASVLLSGNSGNSPPWLYVKNSLLYIIMGSTNAPILFSSNYHVQANAITFIAVTCNSSGINVYANASIVYTNTTPCKGAIFYPMIGGITSLWSYVYLLNPTGWTGGIANVQIYNKSLSGNSIISIYKAGPFGAPTNSSLVAWYPLNGNANDYSGFGNSALASNIIYYSSSQLTLNMIPSNSAYANFGISTSGGRSAFGIISNSVAPFFIYPASGQQNFSINVCPMYSRNLVSWLPLNFPSSTAYELAHGNNGTFINASWSPKPSRISFLSANFSTPNSIVNSTFQGIITTQGLTISAWVRWLGGNYMQNIAEAYGVLTKETISIGINGTKGPFMRWGYTSNSLAILDQGNPMAKGSWHMVTGVWNGVANTLSLYVDGKLISTSAAASAPLSTFTNLNIGGKFSGISAFNGSIANMQLYGIALSQQQIQSLFNSGIASVPYENSNLLSWYLLAGNSTNFSQFAQTINSNVIFSNSSYTYYNNSYMVANFTLHNAIYSSKLPISLLGPNYTVSQWFMLKSEASSTSTVNGRQNPIVDIYNASKNNGIGSGQNFDYGGSWAGGSSMNFAWGEYWPNGWSFCSTPAGSILPGVWYNAIVSVSNYNNVTIYIDGQKEANCTLSVSYSSAKTYSSNLAVSIGANPPGGLETANAMVTNVQIFNKALSADKAMALYSQAPLSFEIST